MTKNQFIKSILKYGTLQVFKEGKVFTLFMTGENLSNGAVFNEIVKLVSEYTRDTYPIIEALKNDKQYLLMVSAPVSKTHP